LLSFLIIYPASIFAGDLENIIDRLSSVDSFHADFIQKSTDDTGHLLHSSTGEFWIKKPGMLYFHIKDPDESIMVSNGDKLWFYDVPLNQVIIKSFEEFLKDSPIKLIMYNQNKKWKSYEVKQLGDSFKITPKYNTLPVSLTISVTSDGIIDKFSILEDGITNSYILKSGQYNQISSNKFIFNLPKDIALDDQSN
jgi:outer membrane lipoprotein carrier protein